MFFWKKICFLKLVFLLWCCRCIILRIFLQVRRPRPPDGVPGPSRLGGQGGVLSGIFQHFLENKGNPAQKKSLSNAQQAAYPPPRLFWPKSKNYLPKMIVESVFGLSWEVQWRCSGVQWGTPRGLGVCQFWYKFPRQNFFQFYQNCWFRLFFCLGDS